MMQLARHAFGVAIEHQGQALPLTYIMGIGRNYAEHAKEQSADVPTRPMVFTKSPSSTCLDGDLIIIPKACQDRPQVDFEAELAVIIGLGPGGKPCRDVPREEALRFVLAYTAANDVSARWWQKEGSGGQFCRGKSFDTFCPLGPCVVAGPEVTDPQRLRVRCRLNGETMQDASTADMIFPVAELIAELSRGATLKPGTVILTGTPSGVGFARTPPVFLKDGDRVEVEIDGIGVLRNTVRAE
jgi:2-keto-4-pentenoate hydratase/2-oxohepta-3-ene-1,7-dioic acid hydratase in catechol pathway